MTEVMLNIVDKYSGLFEKHRQKIEEGQSDYINGFREEAMQKFRELGIPGKKSEAYLYTDLLPHFRHEYKDYFFPENVDVDVDELFHCDVEELDTHGMVLLNGLYPRDDRKMRQLPSGVWVGSLSEASKDFPEVVKKHFGAYLNGEKDGLVQLNTAMAADGVFVYVPRGVVMDKPIQVVNLVYSEEDLFVQHRNLIVVEENAKASMIVCDHTLSPHKFLTNAVTEVYVGDNAAYDLIRIQNEQNSSAKLTHTFIHQERDSRVNTHNMTLHGGLVRNTTYARLNGPGADLQALGLYLTDKWQHVDNFVIAHHAAPHCTSNQLFKGILDDMSTGAFNGRIIVDPDAQKTEAYQSNNSILLTDDARMDTKPQLEIYADDVKCSHGATVGQLDEEALFYMRSRGIPFKEARMLLMFGFAHDVIRKISVEPLRDRIDELVLQRLRGELSRCAACTFRCD